MDGPDEPGHDGVSEAMTNPKHRPDDVASIESSPPRKRGSSHRENTWIPACAGMTKKTGTLRDAESLCEAGLIGAGEAPAAARVADAMRSR